MAPKGAVARRSARTRFTTSKLRKKAGCYDEGRPSDVAVEGSLDHGHRKEDTKVEVVTKSGGFSTPKAERYKIPAIETCPPAPKKRRPSCWLRRKGRRPSCWLRRKGRRPRPYVASPDIEMFFLHALGVGGLSV